MAKAKDAAPKRDPSHVHHRILPARGSLHDFPSATIALSDLAQQFIDLVTEERTATDRFLRMQAGENYEAAGNAVLAAQEATRQLAETICATPVQSIDNLIEKAIVNREYCPRWKDGTRIDAGIRDLDLASATTLALGALSLAGLTDTPTRPSNPPATNASADRQARRRGEDPTYQWRLDKAEYELIKIDALGKLIWCLADGFKDAEKEALQYISNRLMDHHGSLRATLYDSAEELAKAGHFQ